MGVPDTLIIALYFYDYKGLLMGLIPSFRLPNSIPVGAAHDTVRSAIQSHDNSITDLNQAIVSLKSQIDAKTSTSTGTTGTSSSTTTSTENVTNTTVISGGVVNNQSGVLAYTTTQNDNGAIIVLADALPVALTLNNSVTIPWYCFVYNGGTSDVTVTGQQGTIDGHAHEIITPGLFTIIFFDGSNYFAAALPIVPLSFTADDFQFINAYDATTGIFSASQPDFGGISGNATTAQIGKGTPSAGKYVDGGTGAWTALPSLPVGLSVTIVTAALTGGGTQGSQVFTNGILVSQVQAT